MKKLSVLLMSFLAIACSNDDELEFKNEVNSKATKLTTRVSGSKVFEPIDDAYLQNGTGYDQTNLRVEQGTRESYLKFDLSNLSSNSITSATLKLTVDSDNGYGQIEVYKGNSSNWNENSLTSRNKPNNVGSPIGKVNGTYELGDVISISLDASQLTDSKESLIISLLGSSNDFDFASKEHTSKTAPQLVVNYSNNSSSVTGENPSVITAVDDAYLEGGVRYSSTNLRVENDNRESYLKFDLSNVTKTIQTATLKFTVNTDDGHGQIQVYKGSSNNWTEENLSTSNKPNKVASIGSANGTYQQGNVVSIKLNPSQLNSSQVSLIVMLSGSSNDFDFASKEHDSKAAPQLVLTYEGEATSSSNSKVEDKFNEEVNTNNNSGGIAIPTNGRFNSTKDLLLAHFDFKPDVDDLHAVAAFKTLLSHSDYSGINYHVVAGTYSSNPTRESNYAYTENVNSLMGLAFTSDKWTDAHNNVNAAITKVKGLIKNTLNSGGDVWIAEGGPSDFTADVIASLKRDWSSVNIASRIHVVQHSGANEKNLANVGKLSYVKNNVKYTKIDDGNYTTNNTPGFSDSKYTKYNVRAQIKNSTLLRVWEKAIDLANASNCPSGTSSDVCRLPNGQIGYNNRAIQAGGLDFSDIVEVCWIMGIDKKNEIKDVKGFFQFFGK